MLTYDKTLIVIFNNPAHKGRLIQIRCLAQEKSVYLQKKQ